MSAVRDPEIDPPIPCHQREPAGLHTPVVRMIHQNPHITCSTCGLLLDFRPLQTLGFNMSDWTIPEYHAPREVKVPFFLKKLWWWWLDVTWAIKDPRGR